MKKTAAADLIELSRQCELVEPGTFVLGGVKTTVGNDGAAFERALCDRIYQEHYCRPSAGGGRTSATARGDLLADYRIANRGQSVMESGFRWVRREPDGRIVVEKYGVHFWVREDEVERPRLAAAGEEVFVRTATERTDLVHGFYFFTGETADRSDPTRSKTARLYWHVARAGAVTFVARLSEILNRAKTPFRAKVLSDPDAFLRADAAVVYLNRELIGETLSKLRDVYAGVRPYLRENVPMFTLRLAPGLGAADHPGADMSFGHHRCAIAARGLHASFVGSPPSERDRLASIVRAFEAAGLSPTRPHLGGADAKPYPRFVTPRSSMGQRA